MRNSSSQPWHSRPSFEDITELFVLGTNELEIGELLHTDNFSLVDAMSVIEIMDPKMDTGMQLKNSEGELVKLETVPYDLTWYSGYSLSQTIYTCHYIYNVHQIPGELEIENLLRLRISEIKISIQPLYILKSYVVAVIKCSQLVWQEMRRGQVYEEEDFATNFKGLSFYVEQTVIDSLNLLNQSIEQINKHITSLIETNELMDKENLIVLWKGVLNRMLVRKSYLEALSALSDPQCLGYPRAKFHLEKVMQFFKGSSQDPTLLVKPIEIAVNIEEAFDPRILRTLHTSAPPRPVQMLQFEVATINFISLVEELITVCCSPDYSSFYDLTQYFLNFSLKFPDASPISRSWLQSGLSRDKLLFGKSELSKLGKEILTWFLPQLKHFLSHEDTYLKVRFPNSFNKFDALTQMLSQFYLQIFKLTTRNRSRRRRSRAKLFPILNILFNQLDTTNLHMLPFLNFVAGVNGTPDSIESDELPTYPNPNPSDNGPWQNNGLHNAALHLYQSEASNSTNLPNFQPENINRVELSSEIQRPYTRTLHDLLYREQLNMMTLLLTEGFHLNLYSDHERPPIYHYLAYLYRHQSHFYTKLLNINDDLEGHQLHRNLKDIHFNMTNHNLDIEPIPEQILTVEGVQAFTNYHIAKASYYLVLLLIENDLHPSINNVAMQEFNENYVGNLDLDSAYSAHIDPKKQYDSRFKPFQIIQEPVYLDYHTVVELYDTTLNQTDVSNQLINLTRHHLQIAFSLIGTLTGLAHYKPSLFGSIMLKDICRIKLETTSQAVCNNLAFLNQWACLPNTTNMDNGKLIVGEKIKIKLRKCELKCLEWILQPTLI